MAIKVNGVTVASTVIGKQGPQGVPGVPGPQGEPGPAGKSAYQAAIDGGYVGDESTFNQKLAEDNLTQEELNQVLLGYIKNTGGTITGDLNINGNLTQNGKPIGGGEQNVYSGTYTGNGSRGDTQTITLGFKPLMVIVGGITGRRSDLFPESSYYYEDTLDTGDREIDSHFTWGHCNQSQPILMNNGTGSDGMTDVPSINVLEIVDNGFIVGNARSRPYKNATTDANLEVELNDSGTVYWYIATKGV